MVALDFFATCAPGLEPILHRELSEARFGRVERQVGGVAFRGTREDAWRANLVLRTAGRVLWRLARFEAAGSDALYAGALEVPWERWLAPQGSLAVRGRVADSEITHSQFVAQRVKDAVCDRLRKLSGERPSVDRETPDFAIYAHLTRNRCTLLADTSGDALYRRGWRRFQGRAPLGETLAAGLVLASGWDRRAPLIDPFCGSATLLIEAAMLASNTAPGSFRESFGFERWLDHDKAAWQRLRKRVVGSPRLPRKLILRGVDSSPRAIEGARENLAAAGFADDVELAVGDALEVDWKRGWNAWIATNPPYGERVGRAQDVARLYGEFGARLGASCAGYQLALLTSSPELRDTLLTAVRASAPREHRALQPLDELELRNGALECRLLLGQL